MRRLWVVLLPVLLCAGQRHRPAHEKARAEDARLSGSLDIALGKLKVISAGPVVVRGVPRDGAAYALRGVGGDPDDYRNLSVQKQVTGGWTILRVVGLNDPDSDIRLELNVPKALEDLTVVTSAGAIEAYDVDGNVSAETSCGRVQLDRIGRNARARTGGGPIKIGAVGGSVRCASAGGNVNVDHAGGETWCESAGGNIYVVESVGPVHTTTAGNIQIGRAHSTVNARANGGLIEVNEAGGVVTAETSGGSIQVGPSKGVRCESAAGAIRVRGVGGPLRAFTAAGSILAELVPGARIEESSLNTAQGDVTVFLPSNISVSVRAFVQGAGGRNRIVSDFPEIRVRTEANRGGSPVAEGSLNGGGPVLRINAVGGAIYLRRQK